MNTHIVELNGEPVVSLSEDRGGKANVGCGPREKAIKYTAEEAAEVVEWIGIGAASRSRLAQFWPGGDADLLPSVK